MKRYRTVVAIVFLALFSYQATGTSLVYSLSYQETREPPSPSLRLQHSFCSRESDDGP
jgi:hypothetical protein